MKTEEFWRGFPGDDYTIRNWGRLPAQVDFFSKVLKDITLDSVIELGAGDGTNLQAIKKLYPEIKGAAVEINEEACSTIDKRFLIYNKEIIDYESSEIFDFAFTKGVLIHIPPEQLDEVYSILDWSAQKYVLMAEYYSPKPVEIEYRGRKGFLWKRDFAGEFMDKYDFELINYGFCYHRDPHPQDDITWFLMRRSNYEKM